MSGQETAEQRLEKIRATWWAGKPPNAFLLDPNDRPLGVIAVPEIPLDRGYRALRLACLSDMAAAFAFDLEFPQEPPTCGIRTIEIEPIPYRPVFWRTREAYSAAVLESVPQVWLTLEPLPSFRFLAGLQSAYTMRLFAEVLSRHVRGSGAALAA